ncbi:MULTISPECIES: HAD family hydrolase [unclassified Streptomyces]|uniref:HAD family hydrolase n=1 Tax=unclassified Streptomyces TaxID=2593676 RepID=UPI00074988BE|nr:MULTISPECIES: HAD family hydrolase [unclassified Streptomyces]KUL52053.1 hydrolase [Streptomyces sp. NRRL S-1521]THC49685.1 HAD family hydrolase [Streptomyces sp. A1499]
MPIRAVVWDIDDTLFDYARADATGMHAHLVAEGLLERYGSARLALARWKELTELHWARFSAGGVAFEQQRRDRVRDFLDAPGLADPDVDAWFARYVGHYEAAWALFPDTVPALDALADGYRHAVLSNSALAVQDRKLRVLGVRERFEAVLCAADLGVSKPAAEAFLAACTHLGLAPEEIAYVGDQPEIDARGARDAGLLGVWLDRAGTAGDGPPGVHRIRDLSELPALLRADTRFGAPSTFG